MVAGEGRIPNLQCTTPVCQVGSMHVDFILSYGMVQPECLSQRMNDSH